MLAAVGVRLAAAVAAWAIAAPVLPAAAHTTGGREGQIHVEGEVGGLYPGLRSPLTVEVTNSFAQTVRVVAVGVSAEDANAGCPGTLLAVDGPTEPVDIEPRTTAALPVEIRLSLDAPDACQGAVWQLEYVVDVVAVPPGATAPGRARRPGADGPPWGDATPPASGRSRPGAMPPGPLPVGRTGWVPFTGVAVVVPVALIAVLVVTGPLAARLTRRRRQ